MNLLEILKGGEEAGLRTGLLVTEGNKSISEKDGKRSWVMVNREPVLTLWAAVVAEVLGFEHDEALTLARVMAGLNAYSKGGALGLF